MSIEVSKWHRLKGPLGNPFTRVSGLYQFCGKIHLYWVCCTLNSVHQCTTSPRGKIMAAVITDWWPLNVLHEKWCIDVISLSLVAYDKTWCCVYVEFQTIPNKGKATFIMFTVITRKPFKDCTIFVLSLITMKCRWQILYSKALKACREKVICCLFKLQWDIKLVICLLWYIE